MESKYFIYDGIKSSDMGLYIVRTSTGMVETPYFGGKSVSQEFLHKRLTPYTVKQDLTPLEFTIQISPLDKEWTNEKKWELGQWLFKNSYKEFQFSDDLGKYYYAMATEAPHFETYSRKGFIEITFITNSPYAWTTNYYKEYDLSKNTGETIIEVMNHSNVDRIFYPKIEIQNRSGETFSIDEDGKKVYKSSVELTNTSHNSKPLKIEGFESLYEVISIDNQNEIILSALFESKPFLRFNRGWLGLKPGMNYIKVKGKCKIRTKMQFPILQ